MLLTPMRHESIAGTAGVCGLLADRSQSAALIFQQKPCWALTPVHFAHNGIGFERNYPYLVLVLTFHTDWRVGEHDVESFMKVLNLRCRYYLASCTAIVKTLTLLLKAASNSSHVLQTMV